jgi:4-amino-4-deoxy-L-arabinose transferase-like glycosyltransferase
MPRAGVPEPGSPTVGTGVAPPAAVAGAERDGAAIVWVLLAGLLVRLLFFCGEGLGDDPNYYAAFKQIYDGQIQNGPYQHRFSSWVLHVLVWKLFGISEFTFLLPILLSSLGCIYVLYLVGRLLYGRATGLVAAALLSVNPFEVLNATLLSTDVTLSLYMLLGVYGFLRGQQSHGPWWFVLAATAVFLAFVTKPFGLYVLPVLAVFHLACQGAQPRRLLESAWGYCWFAGTLAALFLVLCAVCWALTGDPFVYVNVYYTSEPFHHAALGWSQLAIYPRQMFLPFENGERLHGFHFHLCLLALVLVLVSRREWRRVAPAVAWFVLLFALVNFLPHRWVGGVPHTAQRIFRYFVVVVPPSALFLAVVIVGLRRRAPRLGGAALGAVLALELVWCEGATRVARRAFGEQREAAQYLVQLRDTPIYADGYLLSKVVRLWFANRKPPNYHPWYGVETPAAWAERFDSVTEGYVVTGGPRLPYYGCDRCIPNLAAWTPPASWTLVKEFDPDLHPPWKVEPLRVWRVSSCEAAGPFPVTLGDAALEGCLRRTAYPLRPQDGLAREAAITRERACRVTRIECVRQGISDASDLRYFSNVEILDLTGNRIHRLDVGGMRHLEMILAAGNGITSLTGLEGLNRLHTLWLAANRLERLDVTGLTGLKDLRVDRNDLVDLAGFATLRSLEAAYVGGNPRLACVSLHRAHPGVEVRGCAPPVGSRGVR